VIRAIERVDEDGADIFRLERPPEFGFRSLVAPRIYLRLVEELFHRSHGRRVVSLCCRRDLPPLLGVQSACGEADLA